MNSSSFQLWSVRATALVFVACLSCGSIERPHTHYPEPVMLNDPELRVGAVAVDVTPPPGITLFGGRPNVRVARGWRGRLECQAIVVTRGALPIAFVTCDLTAVASQLQKRVAELVRQQGFPLERNQLLLMASATEAAPANYFRDRCSTGSVSANPDGFDARVLNWLAERIASAVVRAFAARQPAELRWGVTGVNGLTRNRSAAVFLANAPDLPRPLANAPLSNAVDATLTVFRFDPVRAQPRAGALNPIAVFAVFGMHQNGSSVDNDVYQSDVFGFARRQLERKLADTQPGGPPAIVAIANGIDADTELNVTRNTVRESERVGEALADEIGTVMSEIAPNPVASQETAIAYRELLLPGAAVRAGANPPQLRVPPVRRERLGAGQLSFERALRKKARAEYAFAKRLPVSIVRLGEIVIATLPARISSVAGLRVREAVRASLGQAGANVAIVSSTNGCMHDVTTAEEFPLLRARTASIYGPHVSEFIATHLACLTRALDPRVRSTKEFQNVCGLGQPAIDGATAEPLTTPTSASRLPDDPSFVGLVYNKRLDVSWYADHGERTYEVRWWGPPSGYARSRDRLRVRVECWQPDAGPGACAPSEIADDRDGSIVVRVFAERRADAVLWSAVWIPKITPDYSPWCRGHRFRVFGHELLESAPFRPEPFGGCTPLEIGESAPRVRGRSSP